MLNQKWLANSPMFPKLGNYVWSCCLWLPPKGCMQQALKAEQCASRLLNLISRLGFRELEQVYVRSYGTF